MLPPEWAEQCGVLLAWPGAHTDWATDLESAETIYASIARQIALHEIVLIVCNDERQCAHVRHLLRTQDIAPGRIRYLRAPFNDTWMRDFGPITVLREGRSLLLDFRFDGWGRNYPAELDDAVTARLHAGGAFGATARESVKWVLEGGSIDVDGRGSLLTTSNCLLSPRRNPALDRLEVEKRLRRHLGVSKILWLDHGYLAGDDTGGHIDTLARFCDARTIAYMVCSDSADEHYEPMRAMARELDALRNLEGEPYRLLPLPLPAPIHDPDGQRLPASYVNFLIINGAVLVPTYDDPADAVALERLRRVFPRRDVIGIDCKALIRQYGSLHCITMQLPQGVLNPSPGGTA